MLIGEEKELYLRRYFNAIYQSAKGRELLGEIHLGACGHQAAPRTLVGNAFRQGFCSDHHIRVDWSAVAHPKCNRQVERANDMILQGLKPRIFNDLILGPEDYPELSHKIHTILPGLWGRGHFTHRPRDGSPRLQAYNERNNQVSREDSLDQLDEARDVALRHSAKYQQSLRRYRERRVRPWGFQEGDLVLRLRQDNRGRHKLTPPWEGPFIIAKVLKPGTYKLFNEEGEVYDNGWNIE
jgi:hypothetical protein